MLVRIVTFAGLVLTSLGLLASTSPVALAANDIAYRCNNNDVCLLDPDGTFGNSVNLTDNGPDSGEGYPFWAPDGSRVGFTSTFGFAANSGVENLFTMDPNATGNALNVATQLTHYTSAAPTRTAVWSPDGSKVAFTHGTVPGIYVVNADGSTQTPVTIAAAGNGPASTDSGPTFSPDGTKIAFAHFEQIYIANADGSGTPQPLAGATGHSPLWSPDGSKIAFDKYTQHSNFGPVALNIVNVDGSGSPVLMPESPEWSLAAWSPDGSRIAYEREANTGERYFWVVNADGTGNHPLPIVQDQNDNTRPSWSPDGSRLTFSAYYYGPPAAKTEVNLTAADGTGSTTTLTTGGQNYDAVWKPARLVVPPEQPPLPSGGTIKPKLVWITKRIPWQPGRPLVTISYACNAPISAEACAAKLKGTAGGGHSKIAARRAAKKQVVVATGSAKIPAGKTKKLAMKVTKAGKKLLLDRGSLKLTVTLKSTIAGETTVVHHTVRVVVDHKHG